MLCPMNLDFIPKAKPSLFDCKPWQVLKHTCLTTLSFWEGQQQILATLEMMTNLLLEL